MLAYANTTMATHTHTRVQAGEHLLQYIIDNYTASTSAPRAVWERRQRMYIVVQCTHARTHTPSPSLTHTPTYAKKNHPKEGARGSEWKTQTCSASATHMSGRARACVCVTCVCVRGCFVLISPRACNFFPPGTHKLRYIECTYSRADNHIRRSSRLFGRRGEW